MAPVNRTEDLASFIQKEMIQNASGEQVEWMKERTELWQLDNLLPGKAGFDYGQALRRFAILTWPASKADWGKSHIPNISDGEAGLLATWDHKPQILRDHGQWAYDEASGNSYRYDIWSNIHFGYAGAAAGFSDWVLKSGAGAGQLLAGTSDVGILDAEYWRRRFSTIGDADFAAAFDDPRDQAAIQLGIDLWKMYGTNLTEAQLMEAIRNSEGLAMRRGRMRC